MPEHYLISDLHLGHANILTFKRKDGTPLRNFESVEEMHEVLHDNWNSVVKPADKVYVLGDVAINKKHLGFLHRLNGKKKLICGNHDIYDNKTYSEFFYDIKAYRVFDGCIFSHIPIHTDSLSRFKANIHGHLHDKQVMINSVEIDPSYLNVCCEQEHINYTPIPWYQCKKILSCRNIID